MFDRQWDCIRTCLNAQHAFLLPRIVISWSSKPQARTRDLPYWILLIITDVMYYILRPVIPNLYLSAGCETVEGRRGRQGESSATGELSQRLSLENVTEVHSETRRLY